MFEASGGKGGGRADGGNGSLTIQFGPENGRVQDGARSVPHFNPTFSKTTVRSVKVLKLL